MLLCLATTRAQHDTLPYYVGIPQFFMEQSIYDETYDIFAEHRSQTAACAVRSIAKKTKKKTFLFIY